MFTLQTLKIDALRDIMSTKQVTNMSNFTGSLSSKQLFSFQTIPSLMEQLDLPLSVPRLTFFYMLLKSNDDLKFKKKSAANRYTI